MRKLLFSLLSIWLLATACQKALSTETIENGTGGTQGGDSTFTPVDTLSYEVITKDSGGWYGIWNDENDTIANAGLENGSWGSAIYMASNWKYTFVPKSKTFYLFVSAASKSYNDDITINFYRNGTLIKTATNSSMKGVCKLMLNNKDTMQGTALNPVVTYEVILNKMDSSKYEYDGWVGAWADKNTNYTAFSNPLYMDFAIPSGWKYSFHPTSLPFTMTMQASPYTKGGARATINFYVNGVLVKTSSADDFVYPPMTYDVL